MSILVNTRHRSTETEIMDDLAMEGNLLRQTLDQIAAINQHLGGNRATIQALVTLLSTGSKDTVIHIADLGCGSGDMLRAVADFGRKNNFSFRLTGIDANEYTVNYARKLSVDYPEISYHTMNVLSDRFSELSYDVVIATLFLHHFSDGQIEALLRTASYQARIGIVVNDLHRCRAAYYLFRALSFFIKNPMVRKDGAISVLRGFKRNELLAQSKKLTDAQSTIHWKWAFRFQWTIKKTWQ